MSEPEEKAGTDETLLAATHPRASEGEGAAAPEVVGGRYQILGLIGSGGMGTVYRAHDVELDEVVALKMLRAHLVGEADILERFRREVKLARRVTHANVARTFDIGEEKGEKFLTMEYVDGSSLARLCEGGPLPLGRIVEITSQVCAGLGAAHAAGVVHRDLKPDNVLIAKDGRAVITDFGIASAWELGSSARTLGRGTPVGTPAYMAPEQVEEEETIDARADLYALGVMLYEMTTGQQPWRGSSVMKVAVARLMQPPPDPRALQPTLPDAMAELILRLMARRPDDRLADAAGVVAALARVTHSTVEAPKTARRPLTAAADKSVAVLPWRNLGPPEDDYLAGALGDDLIDALSMTRGLRVRGRGAVQRYRGVDRDAREIGRELGVEAVVEGSVRRMGAALRITARVTGVADGFQLWAQRFDRPAEDALAVIDEEAAAIAGVLTAERTAPAREAPLDAETLDMYLRVRHLMSGRDASKYRELIQLCEMALARAPEHPALLAALAYLRVTMWFLGAGSAEEAHRTAERAVAAGPERAEPRVALARARLHSDDPAGAVAELKRAIALSPSSAEAYELLGIIALEAGKLDEAVRLLRIALTLDSLLSIARISLGRAYAMLGEWEQADALLRQNENLLTKSGQLRLEIWRREAALVKARLEKAAPLAGHFDWLDKPQREVVFTGSVDGPAMAELCRTLAGPGMAPRRRMFGWQVVAELACYVGEPVEAMAPLAASVEAGLIDLGWLDHCPLLAPLRAEAKFAELRARVAERVRPVLVALADS